MPALILTLLVVAELFLFLVPGLAAVAIASRKHAFPAGFSLITTITVSAAVGYVAFWIYFGSKTAGQIFSWAVLVVSLITLALAGREKLSLLFRSPDFAVPLGYALLLGLFYLSLLYLFVNPIKAGVDVANVRFFPATRPGDNIIPFIFAERIYDRAPIRPFCCGDWLSSDRPPLQAGIFLLQRPLRVAGNTGLQYQVLGTLLQCFWACGVWVFLRAIGASKVRAVQAIGLLAFADFLFYNSVYVWPKLLAAAFILFVFSIIGRAAIERRTLSRLELLLSAASFALALVAHPGSVFSAPAMALVWILRRNLITLKQAAIAVMILVVAFVPWTLYQKLYDPPGNRLLKMHLAGVMEPDSRSTWQAVRDSYAHLSAETILKYKWSNVETAGGRTFAPWRGVRVTEREYIPAAIGILNLGWFVALALWLRRKRSGALPHSGAMIGFALLNFLVWCVVLFGPAQAIPPLASYADILLLDIGLIGFLLVLPRAVRVVLLVLQTANLLWVWVDFRPVSFVLPTRAVVGPSLQWPMLALAVIVGGGLFWHFATQILTAESTAAVADPFFEKQTQ